MQRREIPKMRNLIAAVIISVSAVGASAYTIHFHGPRQEKKPITPVGIQWEKLEDGLELGEYVSPKKSPIGDSKITMLRISPRKFSFHIVASSENNNVTRTAPEWAKEKNLVAVVNAGMYHPDGRNVGYMKNYKHINNSSFPKDYKSILAFNRKDTSVPELQLIDMGCQDWKTLIKKYNSCSQSIRMIDCNRRNVWSQQPRKWSMVIWGTDKAGNALMIFCRSPYSVHDFIDILLSIYRFDIARAMYLEGGPEASFYVRSGKTERALFGSYETGFSENDGSNEFWPIPNVIGIKRK